MTTISVKTFSDSQQLSSFAAELVLKVVLDSVAKRDRSTISLSGGGTPAPLYTLLAKSPYRERLPWGQMCFFWGDERCVPPDDPQSSYHQAQTVLFAHVPVPVENIFRARGELPPPGAAQDYARQLKSQAAQGLLWPRFDLVLLGLGADGHTASLFPGSPLTRGIPCVAVEANYQDRPARRVSLTPSVFNSARQVVFLVTGAEKAAALAATLVGERDLIKFPAQRIRPTGGKLWFLADQTAASQLPAHIPGVSIQR